MAGFCLYTGLCNDELLKGEVRTSLLQGGMSDNIFSAFTLVVGRAMAGHTEDRQFNVVCSQAGRGTQGKSTMFQGLGRSFGPYVKTYTANSLQYNVRTVTDPAKEMLWMKDLQHPRLGWASELRGGRPLDGETVKMVSGGDADGTGRFPNMLANTNSDRRH